MNKSPRLKGDGYLVKSKSNVHVHVYFIHYVSEVKKTDIIYTCIGLPLASIVVYVSLPIYSTINSTITTRSFLYMSKQQYQRSSRRELDER